jgi:hypothetical protein
MGNEDAMIRHANEAQIVVITAPNKPVLKKA